MIFMVVWILIKILIHNFTVLNYVFISWNLTTACILYLTKGVFTDILALYQEQQLQATM